jgi:co-chaperonin GroES (HSP10)
MRLKPVNDKIVVKPYGKNKEQVTASGIVYQILYKMVD